MDKYLLIRVAYKGCTGLAFMQNPASKGVPGRSVGRGKRCLS